MSHISACNQVRTPAATHTHTEALTTTNFHTITYSHSITDTGLTFSPSPSLTCVNPWESSSVRSVERPCLLWPTLSQVCHREAPLMHINPPTQWPQSLTSINGWCSRLDILLRWYRSTPLLHFLYCVRQVHSCTLYVAECYSVFPQTTFCHVLLLNKRLMPFWKDFALLHCF